MIDPESPIRPVLIGNLRYPRYAIALDRCPSSQTLYWMGTTDDPWTTDVSGAMRWADYGAVMDVIREMETAEPDDSPGAR